MELEPNMQAGQPSSKDIVALYMLNISCPVIMDSLVLATFVSYTPDDKNKTESLKSRERGELKLKR